MSDVIPAPGLDGPDFLGRHALVVDPVQGMRRFMGDVLTELGCATVQDTGQTREAWAALHQGGIDILFLDWSEEIDAPTFLHALRTEDGDLRYLPSVVMTAFRTPSHLAALRDAGADEFIVRPFPREAVASRLNAIANRQRLFIANGTFFGPDRRRPHDDWRRAERRTHENWRGAERRKMCGKWTGPERRQGYAGFEPLERRAAERE